MVIHTDAEHRRLLRAASELMDKPEEEIGDEEGRLLEMLAMLIEEYEDRCHALPQTEPHKMLGYRCWPKRLRNPATLATYCPGAAFPKSSAASAALAKHKRKRLARQVPKAGGPAFLERIFLSVMHRLVRFP